MASFQRAGKRLEADIRGAAVAADGDYFGICRQIDRPCAAVTL